MALGDAWVDVHANTDPFEREVRDGVEKGADNADDDFKKTGKNVGDSVAEGMGDRLEKAGPELARSVEHGLSRRKIKTKVTVEVDKDNNIVRRWVSTVTEDIESAFRDAGRPGGPFSRIGSGIFDAIGAGFNVSGRSSLIALLIPVLGAIVALVVAAIQAAGALVAIIATIPSLLGAVGLQAGVLILAFEGIGTAVKGAFEAKNTKELNAALKGLTPSARDFVKSLLPLKGIFASLQKVAQQAFFKGLGKSLDPLIKFLNTPAVKKGVGALASSLGVFAGQVVKVFSSPEFKSFVAAVIPSIQKFLKDFGPELVTFFKGLLDLARGALPFLNLLGGLFGGQLRDWGDQLSHLASNQEFQDWLDRMFETLVDVQNLFGRVTDFVAIFMAQLDKAGGNKVIDELAKAFSILTTFLASDVGLKAMEGLVHLSIVAIASFTGLLVLIFSILAALEVVAEWFRHDAVEDIRGFFTWLGGHIIAFFPWIGGIIQRNVSSWIQWLGAFLTKNVGGFLSWVGRAISTAVNNLVNATVGATARAIAIVVNWLIARWNDFARFANRLADEARKIPGKILAALSNIGNLLINAGERLIGGLIQGINNMTQPLRNVIGRIVDIAARFWPFSPAKEGPFSGKGAPVLRGQALIKGIAKGMEMETPELRSASMNATSNITFGPNSIGVNFNGALPTRGQATSTGSAVGTGILSQLAARNTRLAVRTL